MWVLRDVMTLGDFRTVLSSQQFAQPARVTLKGTVGGQQIAIAGGTSPGSDSLDLKGNVTGGQAFVIVQRQRFWFGPPLADGTWVHLDPANTTAKSVLINTGLIALAGLLDASRLIGGPSNAAVRRVGPDTIDAESVTKYQVESNGGPTVVYVDDRNRARRIIASRTEAGTQLSVTVDITQWGEPVPIETPQPAVEFATLS